MCYDIQLCFMNEANESDSFRDQQNRRTRGGTRTVGCPPEVWGATVGGSLPTRYPARGEWLPGNRAPRRDPPEDEATEPVPGRLVSVTSL